MLTILHGHRATTRVALPVILAASLALGGCAEGNSPQPTAQGTASSPTSGDGGTTSPTPSPSSAASTDGSDPTATATKASGKPSGESPPPDFAQGAPRTVVIRVKGKDVEPRPGSVKVKKGEEVLLVVITDHDSEMHVHGVDVEKQIKKGVPTQLSLTFDEKGSFEAELHDPELLLTKFVVS